MKKILLISDNHGDDNTVNKILSNEEYDLSIHLGDSEKSKEWANSLFDYAVEGNNDFNGLKEEIKFEYEGLKFLVMHGHTRGIYTHNWETLPNEILEQEGVDILIHGHSHIPYFNSKAGTSTICPGSTTLPRSSFGASYAILYIEDGTIHGELKKVD